MQTTLDFGKTGLAVNIPDQNLLTIAALKDEPGIADPIAAIRQKMLSPVGTKPLAALCKERKKACIVISDKTRPVPNRILLPPLLEVLDSFNIRSTILIACGMHSPTVGPELEELLGPEILARYEVVNHHGENERELINLGKSKSNIDIVINRRYATADLRILTGFIEPHFMAGFSGGRKAICPGICGSQVMKYAHSPALLESPFAAAGIIEQNPLHEFALEVARTAGVDFIVNVTLNRRKEITGVFAGELDLAHCEGVAFAQSQARAALGAQADIVVTSNGGYPLDQDFYQTVKGMVSALPAVKQGGTIIIASECSKGVGSDGFKKLLFEMTDADAFMAMLQKPGFFAIDQWEVEELIRAQRKATIMLYTTGIAPEQLRQCHVTPLESVEQGISRCLNEYGPAAKITVIPSGPFVIPSVSAPGVGI
jgi:nickel-dependent lactate racemase